MRMYRFAIVFVCAAGLFAGTAWADRGGWLDPESGWMFVEEWHDIPLYENDPDWNHNNGSDQYSMNANTDILEVDVARIDIVEGAGDTEDGVTPSADATVFTLTDFGDPSSISLPEPSDRKQFFLAPLHEPGYEFMPEDPFETGVTFIVRYRVVPMDASLRIGGDEPATDPITFVPPASSRAQVGIGFRDVVFPEYNTLVAIGYYSENTLSILGNGELLPVAENIDTTEFHSIWVNAKTSPDDFGIIQIRAFVDGSTEAAEGEILRPGVGGTGIDPEDMQDSANPEWTDMPELCINLGFAGTGSVGIFQFDYVAATFAGAFDPQAAVAVESWELH